MHQTKPRGQHGFKTNRPVRAFRKRQTLRLDILRIVVGNNHIDQPRCDAANHGQSVLLVPQRRRELQKGSIRAYIIFVQRQTIDRHPAGHRQSVMLGPLDNRQRCRTRNHRRVIACPSQPNEIDIPLEHDRFGYQRNTRQTESAR